MAERTQTFQNEFQANEFDRLAETATQVREDIERFVEGLDIRTVMRRIEDFGRENPVGLALSALTIGMAAGFLMRRPGRLPNS